MKVNGFTRLASCPSTSTFSSATSSETRAAKCESLLIDLIYMAYPVSVPAVTSKRLYVSVLPSPCLYPLSALAEQRGSR